MKTFFLSIFTGTILFYISFLTLYPFMSNTSDVVEDIELQTYIQALPRNIRNAFNSAQNEIGIYKEDSLYDILEDREDVTEIKLETKSSDNLKGDVVSLKFNYSDDMRISMLFLVQPKGFFPPRFSRTPIPVISTLDIATDEIEINALESMVLLSSIFSSDDKMLDSYISKYLE